MLVDADTLRELPAPLLEKLFFALSAPKEEDACLRMFLSQLANDLVHTGKWILLTGVGRRRSDAYPVLETLLGTDDGRQQVQVAASFGENRPETNLHRIAQTGEDIGVVLE